MSQPSIPRPDRDRIERFLAGDEEAIAEVRRWVRGAAAPYRSRLAAEIEDIEQDVLVQLGQLLTQGRFRGESLLSTYVRRMVHYRCLNRWRLTRRRQHVDIDGVELVAPEPGPFERSAAREARWLALKVVASTPESCRELWRMILAGLSYREMSERTGVAPGTLRVRVLRCRQQALAERDRLTRPQVTAGARG